MWSSEVDLNFAQQKTDIRKLRTEVIVTNA